MYTGHLSLEKMFKAILAAQDQQIIWTHNLVILANRCGLTLTAEYEAELRVINEFNIAAKYASVKSQIMKRCTPEYTAEWAAIIFKWHKFLKQHAEELRSLIPDRTPAAYPEDLY